MNQLQTIELHNQRLLTTEQLAEFYGASETQIKTNLSRNKDKFVEGKHYYRLEGAELKDFKSQVTESNLPINKFASQLILYTKRGASRHAKILNTEKAWDVFDELEENYFNPVNKLDTSNLSPELQMFNGLFQSLAKQELATKQLETKVDSISEIVALNTIDWRKESRTLINKMAQAVGGFGAYSEVQTAIYQELEQRAGANLKQRLTNKRRRMADEGVCVSKRNTLNNIDVIAEDKKLVEIYVAIVKEFALKYGIWNEDDSYKVIERRA